MHPSRRVGFRPLTREDLPLVSKWIAAPHVAPWWTDPSDLESVERKYGPRIDGRVPTEMFIIELDGEPVGLIQRYRTCDHPDWQRTLSATGAAEGETAGIDYLLGKADAVGQGFGAQAIREFTSLLFEDYTDIDAVLVTPQEANPASWRALESCGYRRVWAGVLDSEDPSDAGPAYVYRRAR